jgi:hypothetical protein
LHFTCIHSLFLFWSSTHLTLPFIKTPDSWLFHITIIRTLVYIVKNSRNKITIHFIMFWYYIKITQRYEHRIHCKSLCFYVLLKTWTKIIAKSHVLLKKCIQNNNLNLCCMKIKFVVFHYKVPVGPFTLPKTVCSRIRLLLFLRSSLFGQSQVTSSWFQNQQEFKIQNCNVPWAVPVLNAPFIQIM